VRENKTEWLNSREAADYLSLSLKGLYSRCQMRTLPFYRLNGSLRFKKAELDEFIERQRVEPVLARR
jgi:excisionase family DNA binding protein